MRKDLVPARGGVTLCRVSFGSRGAVLYQYK